MPGLVGAAAAGCWLAAHSVAGVTVNLVTVQDAPRNLTFDFGVKRFAEARELGLVVANGTFFSVSGGVPMGDVLLAGREAYHSPSRRFKTADGRLVDLGRRWGVGVTKAGALDIALGDDAPSVMTDYLGGGGILLYRGVDRSGENAYSPGVFGASFSPDVLQRRTGRTAVGLKPDGTLFLLNAAERQGGANVSRLAAVMKALGATDAVFYDGGGATAFSVGPPGGPKDILVTPSKSEDANPTHIVIKACR